MREHVNPLRGGRERQQVCSCARLSTLVYLFCMLHRSGLCLLRSEILRCQTETGEECPTPGGTELDTAPQPSHPHTRLRSLPEGDPSSHLKQQCGAH